MSESVVRHLQLALFEQDFDVSEKDRAFVDAYLANGGDATNAMRQTRPDVTPRSAKVMGNRKLQADNPNNAELHRYLRWKQARLVLRADLTEDELVEKTRRVYLHSVGDLPLRKSLVSRSEDGAVVVEDIEIRDPSLSAANSALELLRKVGGFGVERSEVRHAGSVAIGDLSEEEREARLTELAAKAGLVPATASGGAA